MVREVIVHEVKRATVDDYVPLSEKNDYLSVTLKEIYGGVTLWHYIGVHISQAERWAIGAHLLLAISPAGSNELELLDKTVLSLDQKLTETRELYSDSLINLRKAVSSVIALRCWLVFVVGLLVLESVAMLVGSR